MPAWIRKETIGRATVYLGCSLEIMPEAVAGRDHIVVTDPPYSSGGYNESGKAPGSIGTTGNVKIAGDTMTTEGYIALIRRTLRASSALACYVLTDWKMWGHSREAIEHAGFRMRGMLVWNKGWAAMGTRWKSQHELIAWGTKLTSKPGDGRGNVIDCGRSGNEWHPTEKPLALMREIIGNAEPGAILDPFMGSGSTGVAAIQCGRDFVGIELDPTHFETACDRLRKAQTDGPMFEKPEQSGFNI